MKRIGASLGFSIILAIGATNCASLNESEKTGLRRRNSLFGSIPAKSSNSQMNIQNETTVPSQLQSRQNNNSFENNTQRDLGLPLKKIDNNTWRSSVNAQTTFLAVSKTLAKSYTIVSNDRKNLSIQTDWDKFFVEGRLFRNKVNVTIFPVSTRATEIVIRNSLEYFSSNSQSEQEVGSWLPCPDITDEVKRIVENSSTIIRKIARDSQLTY